MRNSFISFKLLPQVVSLMSCGLLAGCYQEAPEEAVTSTSNAKLNIVTRSVAAGSLEYPITIYAFDSDGKCRAEKIVEDNSESVKFNISEGSYRITAFAGTNNFSPPSKTSISSSYATQDGNFASSALSMGNADIVVSGNSTATLQMSLQTASVEMSLNEVPDDASSVVVTIAKQYSKISLDGKFGDSENSVITCKKVGDVWTTGKVYVLPGASDATVFSISITDETGVQTYGYTYNSPLKAGIPYILNGSFSSGFMFSGTIESSGWNDEIFLDFNFGPGINETGGNNNNNGGNNNNNGGNNNPETPVENTTEIPKACSVWNGHVVALVENISSSEADILLLSLDEWNKVSSYNSTTAPFDAFDIIEYYQEFGTGGWSIPTREEAIALKEAYAGENLSHINNILKTNGGSILTDVEENGSNARYLCDEAKYTFTFKAGKTSITQAGASTKYRLRLVKKVRIKTK